ncbi:MAG: hypothetical protein IT428_21145 [Planctomycetaceae bacterium]|nr:hypothetical protein [Planctomycetaceae bacterium]
MATAKPEGAISLAVRRSMVLLAVVGALWAILAWPAYQWAGRDALVGLSLAAIMCFFPGLVVFVMTASVPAGSSKAAGVIVAGSGLSKIVLFAGVLIVQSVLPNLKVREFLVWVLVFYLATLCLETVLLLRRPSKADEAGRA